MATVRMTARTAAEVSMVPGAETVRDAFVVSGSSAEMFCSSHRPFIREPGQQRKCLPPTEGVSTTDTKH